MIELVDTIEALAKKHREPWYVVKEPHDYPDGTSHFTHVHYDARDISGHPITVRVASYVTPRAGRAALRATQQYRRDCRCSSANKVNRRWIRG
jgi:hypothetical protein